nr:unnamed protein product [Callosobruchus analis]
MSCQKTDKLRIRANTGANVSANAILSIHTLDALRWRQYWPQCVEPGYELPVRERAPKASTFV